MGRLKRRFLAASSKKSSKISISKDATTFLLPKLSLLCWPVRFYGRIKIKRRSKLTSCLRWLPLLSKVAAEVNLFLNYFKILFDRYLLQYNKLFLFIKK